MKIFALQADDQACGLYRIRLPIEHALITGEIEAIIDSDLPVDATVDVDGTVTVHHVDVDADIIIFQRPLLGSLIPAMKQAQKQGIRCIVELDDDLSRVDPDNLAYTAVHPKYNSISNWKFLMEACAQADWLTASTPAIARRFAPDGRASVVRNSLPSSVFGIEKKFSTPPRVGWTGSIATHPHDLTVAGVHIGSVLKTQHATFSMLGDEEGVREQLWIHEDTEVTCVPWVGLDQYFQTLADTVDIGIVPLDSTPFNECKSYLKGLEMAGVGIPFVASPTDEYKLLASLGVGKIAKKGIQWQKHLTRFIQDRDYLLEESARIRSLVQPLTYENRVEEWLEAWKSALS